MCGINGMIGIEDLDDAAMRMQQMNAALAHRGPDDSGMYCNDGIVLGHRRLAIIDLTAAGHQPMYSTDKRYVIVYNGELYNFKELRFELQRIAVNTNQEAYAFSTQTDTEVILASYQRWGTKCVQHFNGMFAFAIWDTETRTLFIARDRLGIKPLYYYNSEKLFLFSSEIRGLLASNLVPRKADPESLVDYLRYQTVHAPKTIIQGVGMLMPGQCAIINSQGIAAEQYWNIDEKAQANAEEINYEQVCKRVNSLLLKSVERRLIADVPFGAFLSGGIDSSIIVGLMSKVATSKVKTFSVTFEESEFSEAAFARKISEKYNTEHHEIKLLISDFLRGLPEALKAMDHPSGDGANTFIVSKATREAGITMALSGLGGDELFAGYPIFKRILDIESKKWLMSLPLFLRRNGGNVLRLIKPGTSSDKIAEILALHKLDIASVYPISRQVIRDSQVSQLLGSSSLPANIVQGKLTESVSLASDKRLSQVSIAEIGTYMQNTLLRDTDQMSMAVALEVRVPFLDHTLVEYVLSVPDKFKYSHTPKKLLVDSMPDILPPEIINRPKMGFTLPWKNWLKNELRQFCEEKIKALSQRNSFEGIAVLAIWRRFLADDPLVGWSQIWYLVVLEFWLEENKVET